MDRVHMKGINKVVLIGYVGKEPSIKPLKHGSVASLALATAETWRNRQTGTNETRTEWHRVAIYGKLVDVVQQCALCVRVTSLGAGGIHEIQNFAVLFFRHLGGALLDRHGGVAVIVRGFRDIEKPKTGIFPSTS